MHHLCFLEACPIRQGVSLPVPALAVSQCHECHPQSIPHRAAWFHSIVSGMCRQESLFHGLTPSYTTPRSSASAITARTWPPPCTVAAALSCSCSYWDAILEPVPRTTRCAAVKILPVAACVTTARRDLALYWTSRVDGRCFWHGERNVSSPCLEKVLRFASRLLTLHSQSA
jgi:hypothetical protein